MDEFSCTTREAALALGVCVRTAQLWVEQGRLRAWKTPGGHRRILRESVNAHLRARERECGTPLEAFDVLIVQDEPVLRKILQARVAEVSSEITVRTAGNGLEAMLKIGERQPQILIAGLAMSGTEGWQLLNTLVSNPVLDPLRIIITSTLSEAEMAELGVLPMGAVIFHQPIQVTLLVAMVRAYHDGWSQRRRVLE